MLGVPLQRVLVDADVLFSRTLRDWILKSSHPIQLASPFEVFWTEDILAETIARIRDKRPDLPSGALETFTDRFREVWPNNRIQNFEAARSSFLGSDEDDLHVHSAAVAGTVDIVVTNDRYGLIAPDIDEASTDALPYEVHSADEFLCSLHQQAPQVVAQVAKSETLYWFDRNGEANICFSLKGAGAPDFAERVRLVSLRLSLP